MRRAESSLWYAAVALLALWCGTTQMKGSDLWWHIANGRLILSSHAIPLEDPWSFTMAGQPWLQHEWLVGLTFAAWAESFGVAALVYWKWLTLALVFALLFFSLRRIAEPIACFAATALAAVTASPFLDIRPHLVSLLGFALLLALDLPGGRFPLWLPAVFVIWANAHGGFAFGLAALAVLLCPALFDAATRKRAALLLAACTGACALNPSGVKAFVYPLRYALDRSSPYKALIEEWLPPWRSGGIRAPLFPAAVAVAAISAGVLLWSRKKRPLDAAAVTGLVLSGLTLAMSLASRRFIPLFAIAGAVPIAGAAGRLTTSWIERVPRLAAPAVAVVLGAGLVHPYPLKPYAFHYLTAEYDFPVDTCDFIEANELAGNVFALWNWGGYLHFRTAGRMKVFADGRADTLFDDALLMKYATVQYRRPGWREIVEGSGASFVLWPRNEYPSVASELVASGGWRILHLDSVSILLARKDLELPFLHPPPLSAWSELASGFSAYQKGDHEQAEEKFRSAQSLMPWLRPACYGLARSQDDRGAKLEAQQTIEHCQEIFPDASTRHLYDGSRS